MDCKYDYVMSLGYNCEVSFRIEDYFGKLDAFLYSWSYELDRNLFICSLKDMNGILSKEISLETDHMIKCDTYQIKYHPRYELLPKLGEYTEEQYKAAVEELNARVLHLKQKTISVMKSELKKIFLVKVQDFGEKDNIAYIKALYQELEKICYRDSFTLVCILEKKAMTSSIKQLEKENLLIRSIKCFAPVKHTDILGDIIGWHNIISETTKQKSECYYKNVFQRRTEVIPQILINKLRKFRGLYSGKK